ncbi:glutathione transferase [Aureococcus anophagefferens]|nr:glutathione transferase [Aureococcus anophagefferens]
MPATVIVAKCAAEVPVEAVGGKPTTVYWDICGLGQCPRYALELAGVDYAKPGTTAAGLHFSNLPYYLDADVKLAQSNAVLRYLGRKHGLYGAAGAEHVVDVVLDQATDLDNAITGPCYRDFAALKPFCLDVLPEKLDAWAARLGGGPYVTGASLSIGDLKIYETLRKLALIEKAQGTAVLARYASLAAFVARVDVDLGTYRASPAFLERPLNNPHAQFR